MLSGIKHSVPVIAFFTILMLIFGKIGQVARPDDPDCDVWAKYYAEEDNTIDAVFIGSSGMYRYWIPAQAYKEQNYTSALIGSAGQDIRTAPYIMEEAVKSQDVKLFVVETRSAIFRGEIDKVNTENLNYNLEILVSGMNPSYNKCKMIQDLYISDQGEKLTLMFPILRYHENFISMDRQQIADRMNPVNNEFKFANQSSKIKKQKEPVVEKSDKKYISDEAYGYLDDIVNKADELGVKVLFVSTPYATTAKQGAVSIELDEYLKGKGYDYIDLNLYNDEIGLDYKIDFYNSRHTNISGAQKVTTYLGTFIKDKYGLTSQLTDESKADWDNAVKVWDKEAARLMDEWKEKAGK